ncbi:MAG: hypothetical protein HC774_03590, partial [Sphingomonadales bacterium]|nr:hypothetical protein [Sphingomonadales bacterium]
MKAALPVFATEVVTLRAGSATQIDRLLREMVGENVVTHVEPALNRISIAGTAEERAAARQLIARFDVDALAGMQFELRRLETVDPSTLAEELGRIFEPPFDIIGTRVRVVPLPRLRSILLIAAERADIARVMPWIDRLDAGVAGERRLYSYSVQHGRARDVALILQRVLGMEALSPAADAAAPRPDDRSTAAPVAVPGRVDDAAPPPPPLVPASSTRAGPRIVPSDETNSLIIYADGEEYDFIRDVLSRLDQPVPQVLIEAILAEVTLNRDFQFGVNFDALTGNTQVSNSSTSGSVPVSVFPGLSVAITNSSAAVVLNALQSRTDVRVLSAPKLVVLNNQTAILQVGDQVPVVTQQVQGVSSPGAPIINSVELRDTGVILRVTPRVNDSGVVTLDISQEVSDVARTTSSGINSPTIQQRRIASVVATRSGQMVALGGLAPVLISSPVVPEIWVGPGIYRLIAGLVTGGLVVVAAIQVYGRTQGRNQVLSVAAVAIVGFFVYRWIIDPAITFVETNNPRNLRQRRGAS